MTRSTTGEDPVASDPDSEQTLLAGGDELPLYLDLPLRRDLRPGDLEDPHRPFADLFEEISRAGMPYVERLPSKRFRLSKTEPHPERLAAAVAAAGPRRWLEDHVTDLVHTSGAANLIATLRRRRAGGFRLPDDDGPGADGVLLIGLHIGPPAATAFHLAASGASVVQPVFRHARPSPFFGLRRIAGMTQFPAEAAVRIVPVPHPMGAYALTSAARAGRTIVWQPDAIVGGAGARSAVRMSLFGVERAVSPFPFIAMNRYGLPCWLGFSRIADDGEVEFHYRRLTPPVTDVEQFFAYLSDVTEEVICANIDQWTQWIHYPHV